MKPKKRKGNDGIKKRMAMSWNKRVLGLKEKKEEFR